jgi:hypothetical protein
MHFNKFGQWNLNGSSGFSESLAKSAKDNALHRLFRDLAPHVKQASLGNVSQDKDGFSHSNTPHKDGLISFDIQHDPAKMDTINKILESHGHFRHPNSFGEDMGIGEGEHHQYGILQLHPERAKHLKGGPELSAKIKPGRHAKVNQQAIGSQNLMGGSMTGDEGDVRSAKWQGSDPRHDPKTMDRVTRAGNTTAVPANPYSSGGKASAAVTGVSDKGYERVETGKPVQKK